MVNLASPEALGVDTSLPAGDASVVATMTAPDLTSPTPGLVATPMDTATGSGTRAAVVDFAKRFLGDPYVWGGTRPGGFDCSGFTQYVVGNAGGISLPRISYQQQGAGQAVPIDQLQPGDLVTWDNSSRNPGADHVAIYVGNGQIIEAPHPGGHVQIVPIGVVGKNPQGVHLNYSGD